MIDPNNYSQEDLNLLRILENRVQSGTATARDRIELALLYWEPFHREDAAMDILEATLRRDPTNGEVTIWLGYLYVHYGHMYRLPELTKEAHIALLQETAQMLRQVVSADPEWAPAGRIVLQEALSTLEALGVKSNAEQMALLEAAVRERPEWVSHRSYLAHAYLTEARYEEALQQIALARANLTEPQKCLQIDRVTYLFEVYITGRCGVGCLLDDLERSIHASHRMSGEK